MGKSNRIRSNRATQKISTPGAKQKKGMPSWAMTAITLVITFAILLGVAVSLINANGVFKRVTPAMSSDNFTVNANMMSYYFQTQYQNFATQNSSYLSYLLDTSKSLKEQYYTKPTDTTEGVTWFDYFMDQTVESVKTILLYCEEAETRGIADLTDEEKADIDAAISDLKSVATSYGYTLNSYISAMYGAGVKETDVRKAMEYSAIASRCMTVITEELEAAITEDRITAEYDKNTNKYNVVDYTYYTFKVDYNDAAEKVLGKTDYTDAEETAKKTEILAKYKEMIAEAQAKADALKAITDPTAFKTKVLEEISPKTFDDLYAKKTVKDADKPTEANLATLKNELIASVIADILADKKETTDAVEIPKDAEKVTVFEIEVTATYAKTLNEVKSSLFDSLTTSMETYVADKKKSIENDDFSKWAFDSARAEGDTKILTTGDGAAEGELKAEKEYTNISVYLLRKPQYRDTEKTRDVSYMLFSSKDKATNAIKALKAGEKVTADSFKAYAEGNEEKSMFTTYENYSEGSFGVAAFDEWLFNEKTVVGTMTDEPITMDSSTYAVAFYAEEGDELWHVDVKSAILTADYDTQFAALEAKYELVVKEKTINKVDA